MKHRGWVVLAAFVSVISGTKGEFLAPLRDALKHLGLTPQTARLNMNLVDLYGSGAFVLPFARAALADPYRFPLLVRATAEVTHQNTDKPSFLLAVATARINERVWRGFGGRIFDPMEPFRERARRKEALITAIAELHALADTPLTDLEREKLRRSVRIVPEPIAKLAAFSLFAARSCLSFRQRAFIEAKERLPLPDLFLDLLTSLSRWEGWKPREWGDHHDRNLHTLMRLADLKLLFAGGQEILMALEEITKPLRGMEGLPPFSFRWKTPFGWVVLGNFGDDEYPSDEPFLFVLDLKGNDTYDHGGATLSWHHPLSVVIDCHGNDVYRSSRERPSIGAGVLGYGVVVDMEGNDYYEGLGVTQGVGIFGVGILWDWDGNDRYVGRLICQGAGFFGIGMVLDLRGDDRYDCYLYAQGFGGPKGYGLLYDGAGKDTYIANDADIRFPSPQTKDHNTSLVQGCGYGWRADYRDGHSLAGGIGVLIDVSGDDLYSSGVFGQGVGYWWGVGMLWDGGGDDVYRGVWYGQGSAAHFAAGALIDEGGNDDYFASHHMVMGAGHDFSVGILIDAGGNDRYECQGGFSLGAGNANGIGFFWDKGGNDIYRPRHPPTLGRANPSHQALRRYLLCLGLFLDTGGHDDYPKSLPGVGDGKVWVQKPLSFKGASAFGVGWDGEAETEMGRGRP